MPVNLNAIRAFDPQERPKHFFDMDGYEPQLAFKTFLTLGQPPV